MIVAMWVNLGRMLHLPNLLTTTIPVSLLASLLRLKKPMAVRMKGKETREHHRSSQEVKVDCLEATRDSHITVTRSLTASTTQTATNSHVDEGLRPVQPSIPREVCWYGLQGKAKRISKP